MNTLRLDPTRTGLLRQAMVADCHRRMAAIKAAVLDVVGTQDAFGLAGHNTQPGHTTVLSVVPHDRFTTNTRWQFATDDKKLEAYQAWLKGEVDKNLLTVDPKNKDAPWVQQYIGKAYKGGVERAYSAANTSPPGEDLNFVAGGKAAFLKMAFQSPVMETKLRLLSTRAFTQLKGIGPEMDKQMTIILAQGLASGKGPKELAKELAATVDGLDKKRAMVIARTEIVHAHNEGQLDSFEMMGAEGVGVMAEWSTAHDGNVCPLCAPLEGVVFKLDEARGLLPRHPNCRCSWVPANVDEHEHGEEATEDEPSQTYDKVGVDAAIKESITAESPKAGTIAEAFDASTWAGADVNIAGKLTPGSRKWLEEKAAAKAAQAAAQEQAKAAAEAKKAEAAFAHGQKVKAGIAKGKLGLPPSAYEIGAGGLHELTPDAIYDYATKHGVDIASHEAATVLEAMAAKGIPKVAAQADALQAVVAKKKAEQAAEKALVDAAATKVQGWQGTGLNPTALDHADYSSVPGWQHQPSPSGLTQSYGVVLFDDQGRVLLRSPKDGYGGAAWTFAKGGGTQAGTTALKEVGEETGHKAAIFDVLPGGYKGQTTKTNYFLGKSVGYDHTLMDKETEGVKWLPYADAKKAILLGTDAKVVARDLEVLEAAYAHLVGSDGAVAAGLAANGQKTFEAAVEAAEKAAHSYKIKTGAAKAHYAKDKFGGGVTDSDYTSAAKQKLNPDGLNKVLSEKGWHLGTLPVGMADTLQAADDIVTQKALLDGLKKAPKGTPQIPLVAPAPAQATPTEADLDALFQAKNKAKVAYLNATSGEDELAAAYKKANAAYQTAVAASKATPPAIPTPTTGFPFEGELKKIKDLPGSTKPYLAEDKAGKKWVVKDVGASNIEPGHLRSEATADRLYQTLGYAVPKGTIRDTPSGPQKITEFLEGGQTLAQWKLGKSAAQIEAMYKEIQKGFVADALFANHDVAGAAYDNIFIHNGQAYRIDNGGALNYRAQGGKKATWGPKVTELASLRNPDINHVAASIYKGITDADIHKQIEHIVNNRDALLAQVADAGVRDVLAQRIDNLASQLPAKQPTETPRKTPTGAAGGAEYGITAQTPARVVQARSNGLTLAVDRGDIEDTNVLVWQEHGHDNKPTTVVQLKVTGEGNKKVEAALAQELQAAKKVGPPPPVSNVHPDDSYSYDLINAAKTVNKHQHDGQYNTGYMAAYQNKKEQITKELATATGAKKEMLEHYQKAVGVIDAAMAGKKATSQPISAYAYTPPKEPVVAATPLRRGITAARSNSIDMRVATYTGGVGKVAPQGTNTIPGNGYKLDLGEGITAHYVPRDDSTHEQSALALHGTIRVTLPEQASEQSIKKAMTVLGHLGLDSSTTTPDYEEALYLHRGVYINKLADTPSYKAIWENKAITDAEKVKQLKAWVKTNMGIDPEKQPGYNPAGTVKHADGSGHRVWERWDLPQKDIDKDMKGYTVFHSSGTADNPVLGSRSPVEGITGLLKGVIDSGGEFTSTTGRIRKGVPIKVFANNVNIPITGGASASSDVLSGGASYMFTRIKEPGADATGFHFKPSTLRRQDAISYDHDVYGRITYIPKRESSTAKFKEFAGRNGGENSNETLFKEGLSLTDLSHIAVENDKEKKKVLQVFTDRGITALPDGRPVTDIVLTLAEHKAKAAK